MRGRRLVTASYSIAKQLPSEVGLHQDDFSNEKSVLTVLTSSFALLAFSKYRRAQATPVLDLYCLESIYSFFYSSFDIKIREPFIAPVFSYRPIASKVSKVSFNVVISLAAAL